MDDEQRLSHITLRLPKALHSRLTESAERNSRSMNAEIVSRLDASFTTVEERLAALEAEVFHPKLSLEEVRGSIEVIEQDLNRGLEDLQREIGYISRSMR